MNFKPTSGKVLIEFDPAKNERTLASGLIIQMEEQEVDNRIGTVIAVADYRTENGVKIPTEAKVGDRILMYSRQGNPVKMEGKTYYMFSEGDIIGKFIKE